MIKKYPLSYYFYTAVYYIFQAVGRIILYPIAYIIAMPIITIGLLIVILAIPYFYFNKVAQIFLVNRVKED